MNLITCRVEGCSGLTSDTSGVCPACRTKVRRGEAVLVTAKDYQTRTDILFRIFFALVVGLLVVTVVGHNDFAGGVR